MAKIINKKGVDITGNVEQVPVEHTVDVELTEQPGERVGGNLVVAQVLVNSERLTQFVNQIAPEVATLPVEQRQRLDAAIEDLRGNDAGRNQAAVEWLYHIAILPDSGALSGYICSFLGVPSPLGS